MASNNEFAENGSIRNVTLPMLQAALGCHCRYEYDWERNLRHGEPTTHFNPGFTAQVNAHHHARSVADSGILLEVHGGSKNLGLKAVSLQEMFCALQQLESLK
jgi:hypothetical protein